MESRSGTSGCPADFKCGRRAVIKHPIPGDCQDVRTGAWNDEAATCCDYRPIDGSRALKCLPTGEIEAAADKAGDIERGSGVNGNGHGVGNVVVGRTRQGQGPGSNGRCPAMRIHSREDHEA